MKPHSGRSTREATRTEIVAGELRSMITTMRLMMDMSSHPATPTTIHSVPRSSSPLFTAPPSPSTRPPSPSPLSGNSPSNGTVNTSQTTNGAATSPLAAQAASWAPPSASAIMAARAVSPVACVVPLAPPPLSNFSLPAGVSSGDKRPALSPVASAVAAEGAATLESMTASWTALVQHKALASEDEKKALNAPRTDAPLTTTCSSVSDTNLDSSKSELQLQLSNEQWHGRWLFTAAAASAAANADTGEPPILTSFVVALARIQAASGFLDFLDPLEYVQPFLTVIRTEKTTAPIAGVALSSVQKFLLLVLDSSLPNISNVMAEIAGAATHCKFDPTDSELDQVTLSKLLQVILACVQSQAGIVLSNCHIMELFETCYRMTQPSRQISTLLRSLAESTLIQFAQTIFTKYIAEHPQGSSQLQTLGHYESSSSNYDQVFFTNQHGICFSTKPGDPHSSTDTPQQEVTATLKGTPDPNSVPLPPYGTEGLLQVLMFATSLLSPEVSTPSTRGSPGNGPIIGTTKLETKFLGLSIINAIFEVAIVSLAQWPDFKAHIQKDLGCKLLQLVHVPHLSVLSMTIRVFLTAVTHLKPIMKLHIEAFFITLLKMVSDPKALQQFELTELVLETLLGLLKIPDFVLELYANFDCDIYTTNLFKNTADFLYKAVVPRGLSGLGPLQLLALESLLAILAGFTRPQTPTELNVDTQRLRHVKQKKTLLATGVELFNRSPKEGLDFLKVQKYLPDPPDARSTALFLRNAPGLHKQVVGDYLAGKLPFNTAVLKEYLQSFGLVQKPFLAAFREFIESFKLPIDSNLINRIVEAFGTEYCLGVATEKNPFENADACYVLAYSCVILNVDQHRAEVKTPMTPSEFVANNRGINNKKDLPEEMLLEIYYDIKSNEMRIPEEFPTGLNTPKSCHDMLMRLPRVSSWTDATVLNTSEFGRDALVALWGPLISTLRVVFESAADELALHKALSGFELCCAVSAQHGLSDYIDNIVIYLCKQSTLLVPGLNQNSVILFGTNRKANLASIAACSMSRLHSNHIQEGWPNLISIMSSMRNMGLLTDTPALPHLTLGDSYPPAPSPPPPPPPKSSSWFSSFFWGSDSSGAEVMSPEEKEAHERAIHCIECCHVNELIQEIAATSSQSLNYVINATIQYSKFPKTVAEEGIALFSLDLLTKVILLAGTGGHDHWNTFFMHMRDLLQSISNRSPFAERVVQSVFIVCIDVLYVPDMATVASNGLVLLANMKEPALQELTDVLVCGVLGVLRCIHDRANEGTTSEENNSLCGPTSPPPLLTEHACLSVIKLISLATTHAKLFARGLEMLSSAVGPKSQFLLVSPSCISLCVDCLLAFRSNAPTPEIATQCAMQCIDMLHLLLERQLAHLSSSPASPALPTSPVQTTSNLTTISQIQSPQIPSTSPVQASSSTPPTVVEQGWATFFKVLSTLTDMCRSQQVEVRFQALLVFQRDLLAVQMESLGSDFWCSVFRRFLFPLLLDLLNPHLSGTRDSIDDTRLRASVLLSKVFLQRLHLLSHSANFSVIWLDIIELIHRYMHAGGSDLLHEAVPEALKNMLLVMTTSGYLVAPPTPTPTPTPATTTTAAPTATAGTTPSTAEAAVPTTSAASTNASNQAIPSTPTEAQPNTTLTPQEQLWCITWQTIDKFLPHLKDEISCRITPPPQQVAAPPKQSTKE
ncbi:Pattern-formation protein/guanine nucleotide exchange factor [Pelomyxa schiedti]|nr:Pattern-formation protein/guanine nucleotide exchange factor [Pelomyxa schiedti]